MTDVKITAKAIADDDEHMTPDQAWNRLCAMDDRNSPADCPDHCLITKGELARYMRAAKATEPSDLVKAEHDAAHKAYSAAMDAYNLASNELRRATERRAAANRAFDAAKAPAAGRIEEQSVS